MPDYLKIYKIFLITSHLSEPQNFWSGSQGYSKSLALVGRKSLIWDDLARVEHSEILYLDCWSHLDIIDLMG